MTDIRPIADGWIDYCDRVLVGESSTADLYVAFFCGAYLAWALMEHCRTDPIHGDQIREAIGEEMKSFAAFAEEQAAGEWMQ